MICRRCLLRAARSKPTFPSTRRHLSNSASQSAQAISTATATESKPRGGPSDGPNPPSATSSSAAQPFTTPLSVSPIAHGLKPNKTKSESPVVLSSVPAGTPLKGLNFLKNKSDPIAMEDSEYPAWLWDVLKPKTTSEEDADLSDLYSKSKTKRLKAKKARKQALLNPESMIPKVPLHEQSIDLPAGDGTVEGALNAAKARHELTKAMRGKRRASIKEANFLKAMG